MDHFFEKLGIATRLLAESDLRGAVKSGYIVSNIMTAIAHEQIRFGFDDAARPICFWTWAYLAPDTERRMRSSKEADLHLSEWNEGGNLWIMDFVAPHGHIRSIIEYMHRFFADGNRVGYSMRRRDDGVPRKINGWDLTRDQLRMSNGSEFRLPDLAFADCKTTWLNQKQARSENG
jgi:hemolysin-activating ACP:hemolysin acyltransferase